MRKKSTHWKSGRKKKKYCYKSKTFQTWYYWKKDHWRIFTFEAKRKRFNMLIINGKKKSTKVLAYHKPQVATFLCNDVENDGYCCFTKMLNFGSKTFKMLEFTFGIDLLLSHIRHFWFLKMHCQNLTPPKNAGWDIYATPKFWHKIQDLQKSVEYLLNRPRLPLTKSFLQLWDVLKLVYNTHSWP